MNLQQFTQKSVEAIQWAQSMAAEYGNQQIEQAHLLAMLVFDEEGLIPQLLSSMQVSLPEFCRHVKKEVERIPHVVSYGHEAGKVYVSHQMERTLSVAEQTAKQMQDEYISVEHLFMALMETAEGSLKDLFKTYQLNKDKFLQALVAVRGNQRVTSDNPEGTYAALKKYGTDFTVLMM